MILKHWLYRNLPPLTNFLFRKKRKGFSIKTSVETPYYSQYGQDKIINERIFNSKRNGFFVDIGANDGITGSNTYFFEKELNWTGVCIEPQPDIFHKLTDNRETECHNCAISPKSGSAKFLKEEGINFALHTPKKINKRMLDYFDHFLAIDFYVLNQLNINYPKYRHKFVSYTSQFDDLSILDPFRFQDHDYLRTMNDIKYVAENIVFD